VNPTSSQNWFIADGSNNSQIFYPNVIQISKLFLFWINMVKKYAVKYLYSETFQWNYSFVRWKSNRWNCFLKSSTASFWTFLQHNTFDLKPFILISIMKTQSFHRRWHTFKIMFDVKNIRYIQSQLLYGLIIKIL
jgi:hypothetical protein